MTTAERIALAMSEIRKDVESGTVPRDVASFAALHDYVDANEYGDLFTLAEADLEQHDELTDATSNIANTVQDAVDAWIKSGGLTNVVRVAVYLTFKPEDVAAGWSNDFSELEESLCARLDEVIGDDGNVYVPKFYGTDIDVTGAE